VRRFASAGIASLGVVLLAAAGVRASSPNAPVRSVAKRGGTLRVNYSSNDFQFVDPGLSYDTGSWSMLYTTQLLLVNFPEKSGQAGTVIYPEAATSFPTISRDGRTYTFHIRPGQRFSDGSPVTAACYRRAWERILSPKMGSPVGVNDQFQKVVVGAEAFLEGKSKHIAGISANGLTIVFHLTRPNPTFTSYLSMQWFGAVKPNMPYTTTGLNVYPSAGPYYIQAREVGQALVEARNPFYRGSRPANPDKIVWTTNTIQDQSLLQVEADQADVDADGPPASANAALASQYGVNKKRFFVGPTSCVVYEVLNTSRLPFSKLAYRKAVNWVIDRPALVRLYGKYGARQTDQILPADVPGYRPYQLYAVRGSDLAEAKKYAPNGIPGTIVVYHGEGTTESSIAQVVEFDLKQLGANIRDTPLAGAFYYDALGTRGVDMDMAQAGWCADYYDPFDYINVNFDGRSIQPKNNVDFAYLNVPSLNREMDRTASLTGSARSRAYAALDREVMAKYAPWVPFAVFNGDFFVSSRVSDFVYQPYFGEPAWNALAVG
jgi:peptide/nickel transport system substrate-binding protein